MRSRNRRVAEQLRQAAEPPTEQLVARPGRVPDPAQTAEAPEASAHYKAGANRAELPVTIEGEGLPILSWAPGLEPGALAQARNCANLPVAFHHVAVMADGHQGYGVPIGAVLALSDALSPYAVGNDIGCGMALVATRLTRDDLLAPLPTRNGQPGPVARDDIMGSVQASIPAGSERHRHAPAVAEVDRLVDDAFSAMTEAAAASGIALSTSQSTDPARGKPLGRADLAARAAGQQGTLGSGNHFIELLAGPDSDVWVLVHSGSRGFGGLVCVNFHRMAIAHCDQTGHRVSDPGLAWLPVAGDDRWAKVGRCYQTAMHAALDYAASNRRRMLSAVGEIIERRFPDAIRWEETVDIHHNDAVAEDHYGHRVWVHRKGAVKASAGSPTITPGSMGSGSVLGRGLGNPASYCSAAHGAGRALSRSRARRELSLDQQMAAVAAAGGKVFAAHRPGVLDEMPGAYKDLDQVMACQADLVEPVRRFTPLATYKGSETPRRRRGR